MINQQQTLQKGQLIFILSNKTQSVVPAIIAEKHQIDRLDGSQAVFYKVKVGPPGRAQIVDLNRIDGELFTSLEEIRASMMQTLTEFVNNLIDKAQNQVNQWYGVQGSITQAPSANGSPGQKLDPEQLISAVTNNISVQQGNQQTLMSPQQPTHPLLIQQQQQQQSTMNQGSLNEHLRSMVTPVDEPFPISGNSASSELFEEYVDESGNIQQRRRM